MGERGSDRGVLATAFVVTFVGGSAVIVRLVIVAASFVFSLRFRVFILLSSWLFARKESFFRRVLGGTASPFFAVSASFLLLSCCTISETCDVVNLGTIYVYHFTHVRVALKRKLRQFVVAVNEYR